MSERYYYFISLVSFTVMNDYTRNQIKAIYFYLISGAFHSVMYMFIYVHIDGMLVGKRLWFGSGISDLGSGVQVLLVMANCLMLLVMIVSLACLDHGRRRQVFRVAPTQLHSVERGSRVEVRGLLSLLGRLLLLLGLATVETVSADMRVVDGCAHGDGLDEVGGFAEHRAKFTGLAVVTSVLFTAGSGPRVDYLLLVLSDHAGKVEGDGARRAGTTGA